MNNRRPMLAEVNHVATIEDVLITTELERRTGSPRDFTVENRQLVELAGLIVENPDALLGRLVQLALEHCEAGSAGISLLEGDSLRWIALAGAYAGFKEQRIPADFSPCGECLRRGTIELFRHPARVFTSLDDIEPSVIECLIVPMRSPARLVGTLWVMTHDETKQFSANDATRLGIFANFTAASLEVLAARQAAEKASRTKDELLAIVAHELRAPIATILGWAEMLLSGHLDVTQAVAALECICSYASRQSERVEDLIDASRIVNGRFIVKPLECDVRSIVHLAVRAALPAAAQRRITLEIVDADERLAGCADEARLLQALGNLLSNSIKFTPPGGTVTVGAYARDSAIHLVVSDTGTGIDADLLPHVFDHFWQAQGSPSSRRDGLGLGLTIARHIIEGHGGTIAIESPGTGRGTTVIVTLPGPAHSR